MAVLSPPAEADVNRRVTLADLGPDRRRELVAALTVLSRGRLAAPVDTAAAAVVPRRRPRRGQPG